MMPSTFFYLLFPALRHFVECIAQSMLASAGYGEVEIAISRNQGASVPARIGYDFEGLHDFPKSPEL